MSAHADVLVVGGSVAGLRTAEALRRRSYSGSVTILEASGDLPYDRTTLSKKVLGPEDDSQAINLRTRQELDELGIDLRLGSCAASLDVSRRRVLLDDGDAVEYSTLIVATGASARELPGVSRSSAHYLRSLGDANRLRRAMESAQCAVVVGAGFIGSEVAAAMCARGIDVSVVEPVGYPLGQILGDAVGARLAQLHESRGVRLIPGRAVVGVQETRTNATPYNVALDDGDALPADLVVVGIGARPNVAWLNGSGVEVSDGVVCDEFCQASVAGVLAVGDVARWPNRLFDEAMRVEHWTNAIEQAGVVAWNVVNPDRPRAYAPVPYVWSDQHGCRLQIVGRPKRTDDLRIVEDDPAKPVLVALYARQGRLSGAFVLNNPNRTLALRRALGAGASLDEAVQMIEQLPSAAEARR